jgi:hypothetical protein
MATFCREGVFFSTGAKSMGRVNDTISNVNSAIRNLLLAALVGGAGYGGYKAYDLYNQPQKQLKEKQAAYDELQDKYNQASKDLTERQKKIDQLGTELKDKIAEIDRMLVAKKLLEVNHRLARLTVLDQHEVPSLIPAAPSGATQVGASRPNVLTKIEFVNINDQGQPIGEAKKFDIVGDMIYVDYLTVSFEDKYVEKTDLDRSTAIALFQRIFGEHQEPAKGFQLDTVGTRPTAYARGTQMSDFEKKIWDDFWLIANDSQRARELGIDALQGKAVAIRAQPGKSYEIDLRSTGDMKIRPIDTNAPASASAKKGG